MKKFIFMVVILLGGFCFFSTCIFVNAQDNPDSIDTEGTSSTVEGGGNSVNVGEAIKINDDNCLRGVGEGCFNVEKLLFPNSSIDNLNKRRTVMTITQDIVFGVTRMVGTVLTIVIIFCGLMYIYAARSGKDANTYKTGLINAAIGALLVRGAYAIVRLIQYIAKG